MVEQNWLKNMTLKHILLSTSNRSNPAPGFYGPIKVSSRLPGPGVETNIPTQTPTYIAL